MLRTLLHPGIAGDVRWIISEARHGHLQRAFALMATLSALVSGWEAYVQHLRGAYSDWPMWTPVALTPPMVVAGLGSLISRRLARNVLPWLSILVLVDGIVGFVLHLRGVRRLPGGFQLAIYNITMGPPLFAPLFFLSVGLLGLLASFLQPERLPRQR